MSNFATLNTAYSGLRTAQAGVDTTSHNISNAENKDYTRQRVTQEALPAKSIDQGAVAGTGSKIASIERVHNEFVFTRYQQSSERMVYSDTLKENLDEISSFFPDMDGVGIENDLKHYFRSWSGVAQEPSNIALKEVLASSTRNLSVGIKSSYDKLHTIQHDINGEIEANIKEINGALKDIASLNKSIFAVEVDGSSANDLRDKRDALETKLSRLVGAEFVHGNISDSGDMPTIVEAEGLYSAMIGGMAFVSGTTYRELTLDGTSSNQNFYTINYENSDGSLVDISQYISKGRIGALLELRGSKFDENGDSLNGVIPEFKDKLNRFATGLIQYTNSIYAESASNYMRSNSLGDVRSNDNLIEKLGVTEGGFDIAIYNKDGEEISKRSVFIDQNTTFATGDNSLMNQLQRAYDDNGDNSLSNDFASLFDVSISNERLVIKSKDGKEDYTFGIEDQGSNFAGATGMNRFFDGTDASNIELNRSLDRDPDNITPFKTPVSGDNGVANSMSRLETEDWRFDDNQHETILTAYNILAVDIASKTEQVTLRRETIEVQFNAIESQLQTISKVSIDDELVNLMKYQTAYAASGKVITTLDRMIDTLLGIKQ
jgi:flagellar hook-associated protein 1 FlgK